MLAFSASTGGAPGSKLQTAAVNVLIGVVENRGKLWKSALGSRSASSRS